MSAGTITDEELVAGMQRREALRDQAYAFLAAANQRGVTDGDISAFTEAMRRGEAMEKMLIAATGRKGVLNLLLVKHRGALCVDAFYGAGRFREIARVERPALPVEA